MPTVRTGSPYSRMDIFRRSRLETRFFLITSSILLALMFGFAFWTTKSIEHAVMRGAGSVGAGYLRTFIAPMLDNEEMERKQASPHLSAQLDLLSRRDQSNRHVAQLKIWNPDGTLFYPKSTSAEGTPAVFDELRRALSGEFVVSTTSSSKHEYTAQEVDGAFIEVYAPLATDEAGNVRLVGEFYENPAYLLEDLSGAWWSTMGIVFAFSLPLMATLYIMVRGGSRLIDRQYSAIWDNLRRALELSNQNEALRYSAENARREAGKLNEKLLDQIGCELHDGPIQILTLLKLTLSDLAAEQKRNGVVRAPAELLDKIHHLVTLVLDEVRDVSVGLVLPELDDLSLQQTIRLAVQRHTDLTGHAVHLHQEVAPEQRISHLNICIYRFVQEALINAHHHVRDNERHVRYRIRRRLIIIAVTDLGEAKSLPVGAKRRLHLGRLTQRRRVRAFGGKMRVLRRSNGTSVVSILPLDDYTALRELRETPASIEPFAAGVREPVC